MSSGFDVGGKVALVTGGDRGLGRAISQALATAGACVGLTALPENQAAAVAMAAELQRSGGIASAYPLDVRVLSNITEVVDRVVQDFGRIDVLVNNAGVRLLKSTLELTECEWDAVIDVNLKGLFFACQAATKQMVQHRNRGRIVNVASQLGIVAARDRVAYCASKAGVVNLTRALALDWAPYGIRVNAVAPGATNTLTTGVAGDPAEALEFLRRMPIGRRIEPEEIAQTVLYLASPCSDGMTGQTLLIDGGWTIW